MRLRFKGLHAPAHLRKLGRQGVIVRLQRFDRLNQRRGHLRVGDGLLAVAAGGHEFGKDRRDVLRDQADLRPAAAPQRFTASRTKHRRCSASIRLARLISYEID